VPGGVVDAAAHVAYLQGARGGVEAIEVVSGRDVWSDAAVQRPLAVVGARLLVEIPSIRGIRLALRDSRAGATPSLTSEPLPLPKWANGVSARPHALVVRVESVGRDEIRLQWWAQAEQAGGMHPPSDEESPSLPAATGALLFQTTTARVTPAPARTAPFRSRSYEIEGVSSDEPWIVDGKWCALATETRGGAEWLVVARATLDGKTLQALPLGASTTMPVRRSVDGATLALFTPGGTHARLLQLPSGAHVGQVSSPTLAGEFAVVDGTLFVAARGVADQRELRAIDVKTGAVRWTHPLVTPPTLPPRP
jgi:hypothetical protein